MVGSLGGRVVGLVLGLTLVPDIGNIARVGISGVVGHDLGAAVRESNTILASSGVAITVLILGKVGTRVVISNSIAVLVHSRTIIVLSMSSMRGSSVIGRGGVVGRLGSVSRGSMDSMHGSMDGMDSMDRGMDSMHSMDGSMDSMTKTMDGGMVDGGTMVGTAMHRGGGGVGGGSVLLLIVGLVDLIGLGRGLAHHLGVGGGVGAEDGGVDSGGISLLDSLVASLVGGGHGNEGGNGKEGLMGKGSVNIDCYKGKNLLMLPSFLQAVDV